MPLRQPSPIPPIFDLCRFLVSSLAFMVNLKQIGVCVDGVRLSTLTKSVTPPTSLAIPAGFNCTGPGGIMCVDALKSTTVHIRVEVVPWVCDFGNEKEKRTSSISS